MVIAFYLIAVIYKLRLIHFKIAQLGFMYAMKKVIALKR